MSDDALTIVLDNGAGSLKYGYARCDKPLCRMMPNCITKTKSERRRPFIGCQVDDCRDTSGLFYILPFQKGYLCAPDTQKIIWDYLFSAECLDIQPSQCNILITEPINNFLSAQEIMCELLFEEYGFSGVCRTTAPHLADHLYSLLCRRDVLCTLVVDSGYSFTHIIPFINGQKITPAVKRIDVGGKVITNHLKEVISYRQLHVLDETYLINQVKEDVCFITTDLKKDFQIARKPFPQNTILREYILPDYTMIRKGYVRTIENIGTKPTNNEQFLRLNNERFTIPELLFHPSDARIEQAGIIETLISVVQSFPESLQPHFYKNIVLIGGNSNMPGYANRIRDDVRREANVTYDVGVFINNPSTFAWEGGNAFVFDPEFKNYLISKSTYQEIGMNAFKSVSDP